MDQVFAPWRIEWVKREEKSFKDGECVFCTLLNADDDRDNLVLARSDHAFCLLNNYPYNPGHVMVIPNVHTGQYGDLTDEGLLDHARLKQATFDAIESAYDPDGFNAGLNLGRSAGGSIQEHLHTHVVPRWEGDTNFMPIVDDTTVIVEALEETYGELHEAFAKHSQASVAGTDDAVRLRFE